MALRDHPIADSDLHVMEPPDLWQRYIAPEYRHAAPVGLTELRRDMRVRVKNNVLLRLGRVRPQYVDGRKTVTLKGDGIAEEFQAIVTEYVKATYGPRAATPRAAEAEASRTAA